MPRVCGNQYPLSLLKPRLNLFVTRAEAKVEAIENQIEETETKVEVQAEIQAATPVENEKVEAAAAEQISETTTKGLV